MLYRQGHERERVPAAHLAMFRIPLRCPTPTCVFPVQVENIPAFIAGVKSKKEKLFGFGHRVYRNFDPRANIIKEVRALDCTPCASACTVPLWPSNY